MTNIIGKMEDLHRSVKDATLEEINQTRSKALQQAQKIKDDAQAKADLILAKQKKNAEIAAEQASERSLAAARQQSTKKKLQAREDILNQVWGKAEQKLHEITTGNSYKQVMKQLVLLAAKTVGPGTIQLAADPTGQKLFTKKSLDDWSKEATQLISNKVVFTKSDHALDTWGGLIATNQSAKKRLDARFEQRLEYAKTELRDNIFDELMGRL
jgi:vacuolar-type H+-ATPase subunit E/Vma4